jgi:hypothetical protein
MSLFLNGQESLAMTVRADLLAELRGGSDKRGNADKSNAKQ